MGPTNIPSKKIYSTTKMQSSNRVLGEGGSGMDISSSNINNGIGEGSTMIAKGLMGATGSSSGLNLNDDETSNLVQRNNITKIVDTMGSKIKDTVALVCLGDSRGFVHMNHLILKWKYHLASLVIAIDKLVYWMLSSWILKL